MRIRVQVIIESDRETVPPHVEEVACFERGTLLPETLGLRLDEAKQLLASVQQIMQRTRSKTTWSSSASVRAVSNHLPARAIIRLVCGRSLAN